MQTKCMMTVTGLVVGIPAMVWFGFETNWQTALALFFCMFANNASQYRP